MCLSKPGRRCPSHARGALESAQRRYDEAVTRVQHAQETGEPPSRVRAARDRLTTAKDNLARARVDADSTVSGRDSLLAALADESLPREKRARLSARFDDAEALNEARVRQRRLMPDLPRERTADMARFHASLGEDRDSLARVEAKLAVADDASERQRLTDQRGELEQRVFKGDVDFRLASSRGHLDEAHVHPDERRAARNKGMEAQRALTLLSHQRAAVSAGAHDPKFDKAVDSAGDVFRRRYMPQAAAPAAAQPSSGRGGSPAGEPTGAARRAAKRPVSRRRRRAVMSSTEARALLRQAARVNSGDKVTPGKHQGDPLIPVAN